MLQMKKKTKKLTEKLDLPRSVQDTIPIRAVFQDGIFYLGNNRYSKTWRFSDINWSVANDDDKEILFRRYNAVLNSLDSDAQAMITINNRKLNERNIEKSVMLPLQEDALDHRRSQYNEMVREKTVQANSLVEDLYITLTTEKKTIELARVFFQTAYTNLSSAFSQLGSIVTDMRVTERLRIFHDFYRAGEESSYHFDLKDTAKKGQDCRDYICPDTMEFKNDYFVMGDRYGRCLFISDFASYINDNILTKLMSMSRAMMFTITISPIPPDEANAMAEKAMMYTETNISRWQLRQNKFGNYSATIPFEMENEKNESKELLEDLRTRDQKAFFATLSMVHTADSKEQLDQDTEALQSTAKGTMTQLRILRYQQWEGLLTTLPFGNRYIDIDRTLTTESLGIFMPFRVQEVYHNNGIYYGQNAISGNVIVVDRSGHLNNGNGFVVGASGSGKSMIAKQEILPIALGTDDEIIIIDPEREYVRLTEELGGSVIRIAADTENYVNALDLDRNYGDSRNPIPLKSQFIMSLCEQIQEGTVLGPKEKSIIDRCTGYVYADYITSGYDPDNVPTLKDFVWVLRNQEEPEAKSLALGMERFTDGTLNMFAAKSNVDTNNRILCYDILGLGEQMRSVGLLVILDSIWNRIVSNRHQNRRTWIYFDEAYLLFRYDYSAEFLDTLWKRVRKYGACATAITQNISEILRNHYASQMLANSEFVIMVNQQANDRSSLESLLNMSPEQMRYITDVGYGNGLIKIGSTIVPFVNEFPHENPLYKLLTTKPGEAENA